MPENTHSTFLMVILVIAAFGATFLVRNLLAKRAMSQVVRIFNQHNALSISGAKTLQELGLERLDFIHRMVKPRDYKQYVLQMLMKRGVINVTAGGKFYMVEEGLRQNCIR